MPLVTIQEEREKFFISSFDVSSYNLRQASEAAQWSFACWLHLFFGSFKPVFSGVFINSGCQTESLISKIVQPSPPMFSSRQSASWYSICMVSDSTFASQSTQLGHTVENVNVQTLSWPSSIALIKKFDAYLKDHSSVFKVFILTFYDILCLTSLNEHVYNDLTLRR